MELYKNLLFIGSQEEQSKALHAPILITRFLSCEYDKPRQDERAWVAAFVGIWVGMRMNREALKMKRRKQLPERANVTDKTLYCTSIAYNIGSHQVWCLGGLTSRSRVSLGFGYYLAARALPRCPIYSGGIMKAWIRLYGMQPQIIIGLIVL